MDTIVALGAGALAVWIISFVAYSRITESIIQDQEREIRRLRREQRWRS